MDGHITAFIEYLEFEKGLSLNTRAAYRRDLSKFMAFVREKMANNKGPEEITKQDIVAFLAWQVNSGAEHSTIARSLSSIKTFYKYLVLDGLVAANPAGDLETPKIRRKLPRVLSVDEVDRLMEAPKVTLPLGIRDRLC